VTTSAEARTGAELFFLGAPLLALGEDQMLLDLL
jgi:hypothetical protein